MGVTSRTIFLVVIVFSTVSWYRMVLVVVREDPPVRDDTFSKRVVREDPPVRDDTFSKRVTSGPKKSQKKSLRPPTSLERQKNGMSRRIHPFMARNISYSPKLTVHRTSTQWDCVIFYHLPKSGGTSMQRNLQRLSRLLGFNYASYYGKEIERNLSGAVHIGHITPKFEQMFPTNSSRRCFRFTMLREPVDRVLSAYAFLGFKKPLQDCFNHSSGSSNVLGGYRFQLIEHMTYMLQRPTEAIPWTTYKWTDEAILQNKPSLEQAKETLKSMNLVCFLDKYHECLQRLGQAFGAKLGGEVHDNRTKRKQSDSTAARKMVANANPNDISLYQWARDVFLNDTYSG